jgi:hypothetical protein
MTIESLLVPIDYGPDADRALAVAARIGRVTGTPIELLTVGDPRMDLDEDRGELLERAASVRPVACTVTVLADDDVVGAMVRALRARPGALPVIGTAAHGALLETIEPGAWEAAVRATGRTALLVGPAVEADTLPLARLRVGISGGGDHTALLAAAAEWSDTVQAAVTLVEVIDQVGGTVELDARHELYAAASALRHRGVPTTTAVLASRRSGRALGRLGDETPALLAVGAHWVDDEHPRLDGLLRDLVRSSRQPVLLVPDAAQPRPLAA